VQNLYQFPARSDKRENDLNDDIVMRQVALVSYGNKYLRDELTLEQFFRHGVFFGHRLLFRSADDNALLADDFTLWLGILQGLGARRLSLHRVNEFNIKAGGAPCKGELVIAVHYADYYELWLGGEENAAWWSHPQLPEGDYQLGSACPPAAAYGGDIDSYWCVHRIEGKLTVPESDWNAVAADIRQELGLNYSSSQTGPFFVNKYDAPDWTKFPLFPYAANRPVPHRLMALLTAAQGEYANNANPKNENSPFQHMSYEEVSERGQRLDKWTRDVQLRCANEFRLKDTVARAADAVPEMNAAPLSRKARAKQQVQSKPQSKAQSKGDRQAEAALAIGKGADPRDYEEPSSKTDESSWTRAAVFMLVLCVISLLVLALSNLIATHAWLSLLFGLPFALYGCNGRSKE
jgi:hypothetical protein